jgi:hypothetical protein
MQRPIVMALCLTALFCGCSARIANLEHEVVVLKETQRKDRAELEKRIEEDNKALWAKVSCKNDRVRDFLQACKEGEGVECSPKAIDGAMAFLDTQPYVTLYMKPNQAATMMITLRRGQLIELIKTLFLYPTTRFLIIVQPRGDDAKHQEEAQRAGDEISQYLRYTLRLPPNRAVLGPYILPCKSKTNWIAHYGTRYDVPQPGEPPEKENRIRVWVFRTDC